mgnify:CR=1 FL=1
MRIRSGCSVNRKVFFIVLVTLLSGTLFSTMSTFGEVKGKCIEGDCNNGWGTLVNADGIKYVGQFKNGKPDGMGTLTLPDGVKYVGEFKDSRFNGRGSLINADGRKYVGKFKYGKYDGNGTLSWPDGKKYVKNFKIFSL